jgi:hypothetical protein
MKKELNQCAILIASCKAYSDSWGPFFTLFFRYWPDCPFPVYLVTEGGESPDPRVNMVTLSKDRGWSDNVREALQIINLPYVMYILDDVPLMKKVDTSRILSLFELMQREKAGYLRLYPSPGPNRSYKNYKEVGEIAGDAPYRTSTMAAFWDVNVLRSLLVVGENAWQFEIIGTERSRALEQPFLSVWPKDGAAIDHFATAIKKGRWQWDAVRFLKKEGIEVDRSRRAVEPFWFYLLRRAERLPILSVFIRRTRRLFRKPKPSLLTSVKKS